MNDQLKSYINASSDVHVLVNVDIKTTVYANEMAVKLWSLNGTRKDQYRYISELMQCELNMEMSGKVMLTAAGNEVLVAKKGDHMLLISMAVQLDDAEFDAGMFVHNVAGIYRTTSAGKLISCNSAFSEILGYDQQELLNFDGKSLYQTKEDRENFLNKIREVKKIAGWESKYLSKNGDIVWCIENAYIQKINGEEVITGTIHNITDQKESNQKFQRLFEASSDAILIIENDKVIEVNDRSIEIFQYTKSKITEVSVWDPKNGLFAPSDGEYEVFKIKLDRVRNGERQRAQLLCRRADKTYFHGELNLVPFQVGTSFYIQMIVRDISERVLYESSIRESEERFKMLSQLAMEGISIMHDHKIIDCNDQLVKLLGYRNQEELLGKEITEFISNEELRRIKNTFGLSAVNKTEIRAHSKSGKLLFMEATGSEIIYNEQNCDVFLLYDITSRKRTEQALEQSTDRFKNLVENSPNGIFILTDGKIKYINQSGLNLLELEEEDDVYDEAFASYFIEAQQEEVLEIIQSTREGEEVDYQEFQIVNSNKRLIDVGIKSTLTVYDNQPSIQVTINNLSTQMMLVQEQMRSQIAEEINVVLKKEINEHKNTQSKLLAATNFTRNIIESSIDMIIAVDENNCITEFNKAAQQQFKFVSEDIIGEHVGVLYANKKELKQVATEIKKNQFFTGEIINIDKDGKKFTSLLSASTIKNEQGKIVGSMGVSRDITEVKKAEEKLKRSEERYRDLFENATDLIISIDDSGEILYANSSFLKTFGLNQNKLSKIPFFDLLKEGKKGYPKGVLEGLKDGFHEMTFVDLKGKEIMLEGNTSIRLKNDKPHSVRAILRDITSAKAHEKVAREQTAKILSIFNSTENMMMWTLKKDGTVTSFNKNFSDCMSQDYNLHVEVGFNYLENIKQHINKDHNQQELKAFERVFKGKPDQFELPLITKNNIEVWHQVFLNPVYLDDEMVEISCLTYDITDRKEIDRKILNSLKEKEVLLQEVHHRVKNNLQVISSILNLQSSFVDDEQTLEILAESQNRIKTMSYIHETLYQTSDFSSIEFTDYIKSLATNLLHSYAPKDCEVEMVSEFDKIFLDLDQAIPCGLIMNELVSNAFKYAYKGRDKGVLNIKVKQNDKQISLEVSDNGVGLPEGYNPSESESLGIYLVYALIEQLDANIEVQSFNEGNSEQQPSGTRFLITFEVE